MLFKEVVGQHAVKERLIQSVLDNRVSHAQMFLAPEGSGGLALALAYAQFISCGNRQDNDSCGVCPSCAKYNKLVHPDLHFVFPVAETKQSSKEPVSDEFLKAWREIVLKNPYFNQQLWYEAIGLENKQGFISKNESQSIIRKLSLKTFEAEYKVMIIWMAEKMNPTAANKLLKVLEEPPEKTLFILVCEQSGSILPTIISRTQLIKIPRVDDQSMKMAMMERYELDEQAAMDFVHLSAGNYLEATKLISSDDSNRDNFEFFVQMTRTCFSNRLPDVVQWVEDITRLGREKQKQFLTYSLRLIRENFILTGQQPEISYLTGAEAEFCKKFHPFINQRNVFDIAHELNKAQVHVEANGYDKLIFTDLAFKLMVLLKK
jgi:DNA polymerase III subunit delta'